MYLGAQELLGGSIAFCLGPSLLSYSRCKYYAFSLSESSKQQFCIQRQHRIVNTVCTLQHREDYTSVDSELTTCKYTGYVLYYTKEPIYHFVKEAKMFTL